MEAKYININRNRWLNQRVELTSTTNFTGEIGTIVDINLNSKDPNSLFGYDVKIKLDNGKIITSYKFEGLRIIL